MMTAKSKPFDLGMVNPCGRVDVLAAKSLDHLAMRVPELKPIIDQHREVIHAGLNERLGPHAFGVDIPALVKQAEPFFPVLGMIASQVIGQYMRDAQAQQDKQAQQAKAANADKPTVDGKEK